MSHSRVTTPFNTPLEASVRAVAILVSAHPRCLDLQRLVAFDYLVVHTGDIGGPTSLHPKLPLRTTELLVRRGLVERGLLLAMSRSLVLRVLDASGVSYCADEFAAPFLDALSSPYLEALKERAAWVTNRFADFDVDRLKQEMDSLVGQWVDQFQVTQRSMEIEV